FLPVTRLQVIYFLVLVNAKEDSMTFAEVRELAKPEYLDGHKDRADHERSKASFWTKSDKHKELTSRDLNLLRAYCCCALGSKTGCKMTGIELDDGTVLVLDRAVINSAINADLLRCAEADGVFLLTANGARQLLVSPCA